MISLGGQADTDAAVAAARAAFARLVANARGRAHRALIEKLLEIYKARAEEMAAGDQRGNGRAHRHVARPTRSAPGSWHIKNFLRALDKFEFERTLGEHAPNDRILMEPIGVVGLITPWNWPMNQVTLKVDPGACRRLHLVLKPSEIAPLSSMLFAEMMDEAGLPAGRLQPGQRRRRRASAPSCRAIRMST